MIRMQVTRGRPIRYPSGPTAREYRQGQEFDVLSERDAKALQLIRAAKLVDHPTTITTREMKAEPPAAVEQPTPRRQYRRRDMRLGQQLVASCA